MKSLCRIYTHVSLSAGAQLPLDDAQARYLFATLRMSVGDSVLVFNGRDGEWRAEVETVQKKSGTLRVSAQTKPHTPCPDIQLCFAPVKNEKLDFLVMRACELGVASIQPVITERTIVSRINMERMQRNLIEAAEQCGRVDVPALLPETTLEKLLAGMGARLLVHADESGAGQAVREALPALKAQPLSLLIGPEGGFSPREREAIRRHSPLLTLSLGPRILRAETAVIAALASLQAWAGDWDEKPC